VAPKLVSRINSGDYPAAALEFLDINRANGAVLPGLTRRREAERELFLT
jgi:GH24 family phage-related lysozyme (muramidase)